MPADHLLPVPFAHELGTALPQAPLDSELRALLADLAARGAVLSASDGRLRCEAPAGALDAALRAQLVGRKDEILGYLRASEGNAPAVIRAQPAARHLPASLSWSQERFWVLDQWEGADAATYHITDAVHLRGPLCVDALRRALDDLAGRHDILRTVLRVEDGVPMQVARPHLPLPFSVGDLEEVSSDRRLHEARRRAAKDRATPFDLERGPLARVLLQRLAADEHVLSLTMHHLIADGWSLGVFLAELSTLYRAYERNTAPRLPPLPLQYRDYALWQREQATGEQLVLQRDYWRDTLRGSPPRIELPLDRPRPLQSTHRSATHQVRLPGSLHRALCSLANETGTTLFAVVAACLQAVLGRWTGQRDLVIGTVVAGRHLLELEPLLGCFVNFLPLRGQLVPGDTLARLIRATARTALDAYAHQDLPFEEIVRAVNPPRIAHTNPLYNVGLILHNYPARVALSDRLTLTHLPIDPCFAPLDLNFMAWDARDAAGGLVFTCHYDAALFHEDTIASVVETLTATLRIAVDHPDTPVDAVPRVAAGAAELTRQPSEPAAVLRPAASGAVRLELAQLWLRVLGLRELNMDDSFWDVGGTSLLAVRLMAEIRRQFAVDLPLVTITENPTVNLLARALQPTRAPLPASPLVRLQEQGAGIPLFAVPGGAMDAIEFTHLVRHLGLERPFYAFQPVGLDGRQPPHTSVEEMARSYIEALRAVRPDGPYFLAGHSFGGRVAFEMAQRLVASGEEVPLLAIFDGDAPVGTGARLAGNDDAWRLRNLTSILERFFGRAVDIGPEVFQRPVDEQLRVLAESLRAAGIFAEGDDESRLRNFLEVSRATTRASDAYRPAGGAALAIVLFRAEEEIERSRRGQGISQFHGDDQLGWDALARGPVQVEVVPGDHVTLMAPPQVATLSERLSRHLRAADRHLGVA
ncbi:alpha/beta fold hydrolase [Nannocystis sp. RBIL2]|uniref:condensation domain-containing protein n=1 Tax=Nannocystis sp. RBIL2 TaxID=2996788 RepID=UPI002270C701|nr:condensation domain-containing protein [Nannocystis sp. RBIL2]MCY1064843.1 alpha/beta fold hydrolase [Nannocystis sp. RBIL2]